MLYSLDLPRNLFQRPKIHNYFGLNQLTLFPLSTSSSVKMSLTEIAIIVTQRQTQKVEIVSYIPVGTAEKHSAKEGDHKIDLLGRECLGILGSKGQGIPAITHRPFSVPGITEGGSKNGTKGAGSPNTAPPAIATERRSTPRASVLHRLPCEWRPVEMGMLWP